MNKKIDHLIGLGILALLLVVNIAMAHAATTGDSTVVGNTTGNTINLGNTLGNTVAPFNAKSIEIPNFAIDQAYLEKDPGYIGKQSKLNAVIANATAIINTRVNDLNKMKKVINTSALTASQKTDLITPIDEQISALQALATKIKADTDINVAKADAKSIYTNFRTYGVLIPKIKTTMAVMLLEANWEKLLVAITETQARINQDALKCLNVASRQKSLDSAANLSDWNFEELARVSDNVNSLTPENYSEGTRAAVLEANKVIREARTRLNNIRLYINRANSKSYSTCGRTQMCSAAGVCVAKPVCKNECSLGQTGALDASSVSPYYWKCTKDANGCLLKGEATCASGSVYSKGKCVASTSLNQCVLGQTGCNGTYMMWTCVNGNSGYTIKQESSCASSEPCSSGKCTKSPSSSSLPISSDGRCVDGQIACPAGNVCVDTVCRVAGTTN